MELIIFDLDGTLVDSRLDIATSVNELLTLLGKPKLANEQIYGFIGNGVRRLLERSLPGVSPEEVERSLQIFLPIYRRHLLDTTRPYPGVQESLESLAKRKTLTVLTNKPREESVTVLKGLDLFSFFEIVYGGESFPRRKPDPIGITAILEKTGVARGRALMVGDSRVDYETARNASIPICMVSYGLGASEIPALDPDYLVDDLRQLIPIVNDSERI
jgi:phosphoglycolate phosphatase